MSHARTQILGHLRHALSNPKLAYPPLEAPSLPLAGRTPITKAAAENEDLSDRFKYEVEELHGTCDIALNAVEARMLTVQKIVAWAEKDKSLSSGITNHIPLLAWKEMDRVMPGLEDGLANRGFDLRHPENMAFQDERTDIAEIRIGITGVYAAFAATGSLLLRSEAKYSRVASLLPFYHLAVVSKNDLWLNAEDWMAHEHKQGTLERAIKGCANVSLVSGPSKSADIESKLTLGVHGPRELHVVITPS